MAKENKSSIKNRITGFTKGLILNMVDLVLFEAKLFEEIVTDPRASHSLKIMLEKIDQTLGFTPEKKKNAIYNAKKAGWIKEDGKLTKEGWEKINQIFPSYRKPKNWNGKWYLVIFDIPERIRLRRDILRKKLKKLGFGQLQASVWICPYNYLNNVLEIIRFYYLENFVILSETDKLGQEESQDLAQRIWKLNKINEEYKKFIQKYSLQKEYSKFELEIDFYSVLEKDPNLPLELLPADWKGDEAYKLFRNYI